MVKWFCSSALCFNNFTSKDSNGRPLKYYRLPQEESIQSKYRIILRTDGINWNEGHTCSTYWRHEERKGINNLPDVPIPAAQFQNIREKFETAKNILKKYKTASQKLHIRYKNVKRKLEIASQMSQESKNLVELL